ncbi:HD domain-containing protein [Herbaspirillum sp. GCM10030257]|uniref:HD domain-containing protein n=1 Tax=Herbaspirillum sp. GCM10030257 TaxID=3273393 RepID=UPI00361E02C1
MNSPSAIAFAAMAFAREVHKKQVRKYTGNPYADHLAEVAGIVATVTDAFTSEDAQIVIATAWLHDCIEDQDVKPDLLWQQFGHKVGLGVQALSDLEEGNRATRKRLSRERLALAPDWIQTIKCADLISNTSSIVMHDPKFAETYLQEKRDLLAVMTKADRRIWNLAVKQVSEH